MFSSKKPYSAVTVAIQNLTSARHEEDNVSGIPDLVEAIKLQSTGPAEAARAIRKKLKYGSVHQQLRSLTILDGLVQNAGARFQRTFADEMLLERLRICGSSNLVDKLVRIKCRELFSSWALQYKGVDGLERIAALYTELPRAQKVITQAHSKVLRETAENPFGDDEDDGPPHSKETLTTTSHAQSSQASVASIGSDKAMPVISSNSKKEKDKRGKKKSRSFELEAEKAIMERCIAESAVASAALLNVLRLVNREREQISENAAAVHHFDSCKLLRRKILRYIRYVESEQWLDALLHANDELINALLTYEQLDRSIDVDSDSDDEIEEGAQTYKDKVKIKTDSQAFTELRTDKHFLPLRADEPTTPTRLKASGEVLKDEDEDDPFADRNASNLLNPHKG